MLTMTSELDWSFCPLAKISFENTNRQNKRLVEALFLDQFQLYENFEVGILFVNSQRCRKKCKIAKWPTFENRKSTQDMQTINDLNQTSFSNYEIKSSFSDILSEPIFGCHQKRCCCFVGKIFIPSFFFFLNGLQAKLFEAFFLESYITSFPLSFHQILPSSVLTTV